jgi:peroxiredoxin
MNMPSTVQCPKCSALNPQGSRFCNACAEPLNPPFSAGAVEGSSIGSNEAPPASKLGLAVASLVLGIGACVLSLFAVGAVFGLIGLVLGLVHILQKRGSNGMAWWGVGLSIFGILAGLTMGIFIYHQVSTEMRSINTVSNDNFDRWIGAEAPDITVTTLDGNAITLSQLKGKRVVLDFWATWCGPCVSEIPHLERLYSESSNDGLVIIGISKEAESTIRSFADKKGVHYPIASSDDLPSPYKDIRAIPTKFFIDTKGIVQSVSVGSLGFDQLKEKALATDYQGTMKSSPGEPSESSDQIDLESPLSSADPWVGIWKLNPEKSKFQSAPEPDAGDTVATYRELDPDTVEITSIQIRGDGSKTVVWRCTVPKSGGMQNYSQGAPGMGVKIVKTIIDDHTQYLTYLQDGQQVDRATIVLSKDGRTYTLSGQFKDADGQPYEEVEVFEKQ